VPDRQDQTEKRSLLQLLGAVQLGIPCAVCGGSGLYWDDRTQDVETCDDCDRLIEFFRSREEPEPESNVIYLHRNPYTGKLEGSPF
jgi:hypothetical protein